MRNYNQNEIIQALQLIGLIEPSAASAVRAIGRVRQTLLADTTTFEEARDRMDLKMGAWLRYAAAAGIILAIIIGGYLLLRRDNDGATRPQRTTVKELQPDAQPLIADANDNDRLIADELAAARKSFEAADVKALIAMLGSDHEQVRLAAANYLAEIGDSIAIEELERLAAEWEGEGENPYEAAIEAIKAREGVQEVNEVACQAAEAVEGIEISKSKQGSECVGLVRDRGGRPIAGAEVVLWYQYSRGGTLDSGVVAETVTDSNGRFVVDGNIVFDETLPHRYARDFYILFAVHEDYALGWLNVRQGDVRSSYEIVLTEPVSKSILVTDHNDNPLQGVRVWLYDVGDREGRDPLFRDDAYIEGDPGIVGGFTDAHGRVVMTNLPKTNCSFRAKLDGYAEGLAFPNSSRIRLSKGATLCGSVIGPEGHGIAGVVVRVSHEGMADNHLAMTDAEGKFCFADLPAQGWDMSPWGKSEGASGMYTVTVSDPECAGASNQVLLRPGEQIDDYEIRVVSGTLVECLVLEQDTNEPVVGARVQGSQEMRRLDAFTDSNGIVRFRVEPGRVSLFSLSPPDGVYTCEQEKPAEGGYIDFDAAGDKVSVTLISPRVAGILKTVRGTLHGPPDVLSTGAVVYAAAGEFTTSTAGNYVRPAGVDTNGGFQLVEVPGGRTLCVYAESKDCSYAAVGTYEIATEAETSDYIELELAPTVPCTAVVVDDAGNPASDRSFEVEPVVGGERMWRAARSARTDGAGMLRMDGIVPGLSYRLAEPSDFSGRLTREQLEAMKARIDKEIVLVPISNN